MRLLAEGALESAGGGYGVELDARGVSSAMAVGAAGTTERERESKDKARWTRVATQAGRANELSPPHPLARQPFSAATMARA